MLCIAVCLTWKGFPVSEACFDKALVFKSKCETPRRTAVTDVAERGGDFVLQPVSIQAIFDGAKRTFHALQRRFILLKWTACGSPQMGQANDFTATRRGINRIRQRAKEIANIRADLPKSQAKAKNRR